MLKQDQSATAISGIAVKMHDVSKVFEQWQRPASFREGLRHAFVPKKRLIHALDHVDLSIASGSFVAYAGPNGAGKSTTMKLLCGMLMPSSGDIDVLGQNPLRNRIKLVRELGVLFGNRTELWWDHPIISSYTWKRVVWDIDKKTFDRQLDLLVDFLDLKPILHTFARELSLGQRMKADLAMMLLHDPSLILLDEPTIGLDVVAKRQMIRFLKKLNAEKKTTIIVTSHDMDDLEEMAERVVFISDGKIVFDGSFDKLRQSDGAIGRVIITFDQACAKPLFHLCEKKRLDYLFSNPTATVFAYAYDPSRLELKDLFFEIAKLSGIKDVELKKAPIEDVIAGLYHTWQRPL